MSLVSNWRSGAIIFITSILICFIMAWQGGILLNYFVFKLIPTSVLTPAVTNSSMYVQTTGNGSQILFLTNLYYLVCALIPFIGLYIFLQGIFAEQGGDVEDNGQGYTRFRRG
jgi:hypothetical protein